MYAKILTFANTLLSVVFSDDAVYFSIINKVINDIVYTSIINKVFQLTKLNKKMSARIIYFATL